MADKVRIGLIGVGQIGKVHLQRYREVAEAEVVAVADLRQDEAKRVAHEHGIPAVYTDYRDLLARDDIQSVDVALHNRLHAPVTIAALEAGKNVYCEKPISWCYAEARAMVEAAQQHGRMLHVQLNTIYTPEARAAKRLIRDGQLGEIYYAKSSHYRRRGRPWVDGYGTPAFVQREAAGGGALVDMAVYHISRMLWLLDNPAVQSVSGNTYQRLDNMYEERRASGNYNVEELGMGLVRLAGNITYFMEEAWAIQADQADADYVFGSHAGLRVEPLRYFSTLSDIEMDATFDVAQADWRWHQCNPLEAGYDHSQRHWVWAQLGRVPLIDTAGLALKTALITEGIYLSAHLGREVTADEIAAATPEYRAAAQPNT
ncbi:MAG: putative oxidoreductase YcjS [Chloroflexi bacterium ADurb.Bin325]|nr:MAG: putative oxidoreductase YcjS [Chloroflexi bacterium ADurb.Bin325]